MDNASTPVVEVRYKTGYSVTQIVVGGVFLAAGCFFAGIPGSTESGMMIVVAGAILLIFGLLALKRPYCSFDPAEGALYLHPLIGGRSRPIGAPRGERLYLDGDELKRVTADGKERALKLGFAANAEDLARLKAAVDAGAGSP
ncbi:hypothetical protein [Glycomyces sp. NPDC021274]|uniref:hypothetical protein n=1 Tax=Glycomyces sp. NPDC021274 TaxID=3155120 RepID=UPI0033EF72E8